MLKGALAYLERHLGLVVLRHFPGEKDRRFHDGFDTEAGGECCGDEVDRRGREHSFNTYSM